MATLCKPYILFLERCKTPSRRNLVQGPRITRCNPQCVFGTAGRPDPETLQLEINNLQESLKTCAFSANREVDYLGISHATQELQKNLFVLDLDPATAKLVIPFIGPSLSAFSFLFILRIVMSWYPKLPVGEFPYVLAYAPTEPLLIPTRKVIPPLGGVDVTPVVWFGLLSFLNEILVGPQGLLVLLSQQV